MFKRKKTKKAEIIRLKEDYAVLLLPEEATEIEIVATIKMGEESKKVSFILSEEEIKEAFKEAREGYISPDAVFSLTEKGKALAKNFS